MKSFWLKLVWLKLARGLLLMLPLASASAFDSSDAYGTPDWASPDPGSYWQGSARAPTHSSPERTPPGYSPPEYTAPAYTSPSYTSPDYTQYPDQDARRVEPDRYDSDKDSDWYSSDWYGEQVGDDWRRNERLPTQFARPVPGWRSDSERRSSVESDDWRARSRTPSYRFRDDPRLDSGDVDSGNAGYRFRPLTEKELERHQESTTASGFRPPPNDRRQPGTRAPRGEAYGYEPDETPDGFYQRYYRADH
jgi:hypothetical protein